MLDLPNPQDNQPCDVSLPVSSPDALTLKEPCPEALAASGREVLEVAPRKQRSSLEAYRQAANDLSRWLRVTGVRVKPKMVYYTALRVKWMPEQGSEKRGCVCRHPPTRVLPCRDSLSIRAP